jgi:hypothetical protein
VDEAEVRMALDVCICTKGYVREAFDTPKESTENLSANNGGNVERFLSIETPKVRGPLELLKSQPTSTVV